jgi:uracil-DNA glycosylase
MEAPTIGSLKKDATQCRECELHTTRKNVVFGTGDGHSKVMLITLKPDKDADETGNFWTGEDARVIEQLLSRIHLSKEQVYVAHLVMCHCEQASKSQLETCQHWLDAQISLIDPEVIIILGYRIAQKIVGENDAIVMGQNVIYDKKWVVLPSIKECRDDPAKRQELKAILGTIVHLVKS